MRLETKLIERKKKYPKSSPHTIYLDTDTINEYERKYNKSSLRLFLNGCLKEAIQNNDFWGKIFITQALQEK